MSNTNNAGKKSSSSSSDSALPSSIKKFRQSPEIEGFYRFVYENDLRKESYEILERIVERRKEEKKTKKK